MTNSVCEENYTYTWSRGSHMMIKSDKPCYALLCIQYCMCLTFRHSCARPHCYLLTQPDASHVCESTEFISSLAFLLLFEFVELCVRQRQHICKPGIRGLEKREDAHQV